MPETKTRRFVHVSDRVPRRGRPTLFAYGYADLAELFGLGEQRLRQMATEGFNFSDLEEVCREWLRRRAGDL